eukprot:COSAG02_NODE_168_length_31711_cov_68.337973_22_plen_103_part_00
MYLLALISRSCTDDAQMMDVKNPERWDGVIDDADNPYINGLEITEAQRFRAEIKSAFMWTFMLGFGLTPGMPCSTFGKLVRWVGMQLMRCATQFDLATCTAV